MDLPLLTAAVFTAHLLLGHAYLHPDSEWDDDDEADMFAHTEGDQYYDYNSYTVTPDYDNESSILNFTLDYSLFMEEDARERRTVAVTVAPERTTGKTTESRPEIPLSTTPTLEREAPGQTTPRPTPGSAGRPRPLVFPVLLCSLLRGWMPGL